MKTRLTDSRRLTGANLHWDRPSAIIDIAVDGAVDTLIRDWSAAARVLLDAVGYSGEQLFQRTFKGGVSLLISSPIDVLYSMCELNEAAFRSAQSEPTTDLNAELAGDIGKLKRSFDKESRPDLLHLQHESSKHGLPFLWDDDEVSVGYGATGQVWPYGRLPGPSELDWGNLGPIPVALITGTNGKSTTVRMTAAIMTAADVCAGLTSTDFIRVGERVIESGDYSGTGGARQLLRHPEAEMAVLEVARGGLLRRGLGVESADVALITNVAADHLGEYGINTVPELIDAKFIVRRALGPNAPLILNADDPGIVEYAGNLNNLTWWFSMDATHPLLNKDDGKACWLEDGYIVSNVGSDATLTGERKVVAVKNIPASRGGLVRHNVQNAMGATLIALALGLSDEAIRQGLGSFRGDEADNPGRGNWFEAHGVQIVVDFAHNEHGLQSLADSIRAMNAPRVELNLGQAGDRSDELIRSLARVGCSMAPDRLLVCELPGYERGRNPGEAAALIVEEALALGMDPSAILMFESPVAAVRDALARAQSGDVLVFLALIQREEILQLVHEYIDG